MTPPLVILFGEEPFGFKPSINRAVYRGYAYSFESPSERYGIPAARWVRIGKVQ